MVKFLPKRDDEADVSGVSSDVRANDEIKDTLKRPNS